MFGRKIFKKELIATLDGDIYKCNSDVARYIKCLEVENSRLREKLKAIEPVFENWSVKPAVSGFCSECKYCVFSDYNGAILGCCKDITCEDYTPKEEKEKK